jgi:hypothetical protein
MDSLNDYILLGYDLRVPSTAIYTTDACIWEQAEDAYQNVLAQGYSENIVQLLDCPVATIEQAGNSAAIAIAIAVLPSSLDLVKAIFGWPVLENSLGIHDLIARNWAFKGIDVADVNGFFSVFGIDSENPKLPVKDLFLNESDAKGCAKLAEALYPSHAPFGLFGVFVFMGGASSVLV